MSGDINGSMALGGDLLKTLETMSKKAPVVVRMYAETEAKVLEEDAKQRAPWTNRTGQARQRLTAYVTELQPGVCEITIAHGVDYGIYLELAHEKRFATIMPTIQRNSQAVMSGFKILIGG